MPQGLYFLAYIVTDCIYILSQGVYLNNFTMGAHALRQFLANFTCHGPMTDQRRRKCNDTTLSNNIFFDDDYAAIKLVRMMTLSVMI